MMRDKLKTISIMILICILSAVSVMAAIVPEGPSTLTQTYVSTRPAAAAPTLTAYAGNISWLSVVGTTVTQSWQGYVGNITGVVSLDDARNNTLFDWSVSDPQGEVYATYKSNIDWSTGNVGCWNYTWAEGGGVDNDYLDLGELEGWATDGGAGPNANGAHIGVPNYGVDGVNETFSRPNASGVTHASFYAGGAYISGANGAACPTARLYNESSSYSNRNSQFYEVLLYHDAAGAANDGVIYTSLITTPSSVNQTGYDGNQWDFEMLVGEDGHNGNTTTTTYYFYVELE